MTVQSVMFLKDYAAIIKNGKLFFEKLNYTINKKFPLSNLKHTCFSNVIINLLL